jgi:CubicO group peptidase (beta-lactamase class C family)
MSPALPRPLHRAIPVAALLLAASPLSAQATRSRAEMIAAIDSIAAARLKDGRVAGMSIGVVRGNDTLVLKGYGYADLEFDIPTPPRTIYEIGSVTKQFTAAAILQLADQGKLSLDDEITKHLPDYPTQGHRITVRRLLDHTSGIKGYTELPKFGTIMMRRLPKDSLVAMFKDEKFDFAPGDGMVYNNSAYFLAGLIIEKVSGKSYGDYVKEALFDKAGMPDSRYCSESAITKNKAHGYDMGPQGLRHKAFLDHTYPYAAGSLCSTVGDLIAWNRALHGGKLLSASAYQELLTPGVLNDGTKLRYAKGLALHNFGGHRAIEHGGGINGFLSSAAWFPRDRAVIVVLVNTAGPVGPDAIAASIAEIVLGKVEPSGQPFTGELKPFVGTWSGVGRGRQMTIQVAADSGFLTAAMGGAPRKTRLRYAGDNTWMMDDARLHFTGPAGAPTTLRADMVYGYSVLTRKP